MTEGFLNIYHFIVSATDEGVYMTQWQNVKLIFSAEGFYQQSETDKVEAFSFSKKTVEIAPVVWWTGRYQTSAGTGSSIQNTEKTAATLTLRCTISLSVSGLSPYSSSPGQLVLCPLCNIFCPYSVSEHPFCCCHVCYWLNLPFLNPTVEFEREREKTQPHTYTKWQKRAQTHVSSRFIRSH